MQDEALYKYGLLLFEESSLEAPLQHVWANVQQETQVDYKGDNGEVCAFC